MKFINTEYLKSAMLGLIVADALGVPFEFKNRGTFRVAGMTGYGTHNQPVGTWSDDSSMTLATLDSMIRTEKLNCDDIMERFTGWFDDGTYCPYGECFDIGHTTLTAIGKYKSGYSATRCGGKGFKDNKSCPFICPLRIF